MEKVYFYLLFTGVCIVKCMITIDEEPKVCGQNKDQRIASLSYAFSNGNIDTTIRKYPWTVAILYVRGRAQKLHCGGSLISTKHILTASHCFTGKEKEDLTVVIESEDPFSFDTTKQGQEFKIKDFVRHPNYTQSKVYFDVAIIEMDKPVEFSFTVHPICLPKKPNTDIDSIKNIPATLSGYGSKSGKTSTVIHYSPLTIMGQKECEERHFVDLKTSNSEFGQALWRQVQLILDSERKISNELVCTKAPIEELGTCPGDSGSSLIIEDPESKRHVQIGIVYGSLEQCNDQKYPSLYARLDNYNILSFIRETAFGDTIEPVGVKDCLKIDENLNYEMLRAARQNDKEKIEMLIKNCGDVNAASDTLGNTILMYSAQNGNEEIASLLIEKCANVNAKSVDGFTALMVASGGGHKQIVEKLIANGAEICARNDQNLTAIDYANQKYFDDIVQILLHEVYGYWPLDLRGGGFKDEDTSAACTNSEELLDLTVDIN